MIDCSGMFVGFNRKNVYGKKKKLLFEEYYLSGTEYPHIIVGEDSISIYSRYNRKTLIYVGKPLDVEFILKILEINIKNWEFLSEILRLRRDIDILTSDNGDKTDIQDLKTLLKTYEKELKK